MVYSLLYISDIALASSHLENEVSAIVTLSLTRNASLQVTGALLATEIHFVQVLEGPRASVEDLMASISKDPRHTNLRVMDTHHSPQRDFSRWSLAYVGPSEEAERQIRILRYAHDNGVSSAAAAIELVHQIKELAWQHDHWRTGNVGPSL
jgi:hypothetical protein